LKKMETKLESRKLMEKAKGILMNRNNIKEDEAMKLLQNKSRDSNKKISEISREIIEADKIISLNKGN